MLVYQRVHISLASQRRLPIQASASSSGGSSSPTKSVSSSSASAGKSNEAHEANVVSEASRAEDRLIQNLNPEKIAL